MIKLHVYRHKTDKNVYLARNWHFCGGNEVTEFYFATEDLMTALKDAQRDDFLSWYYSFPELSAKITKSKEFEFDGYKGTAKKEVCYPLNEFECITLMEQED